MKPRDLLEAILFYLGVPAATLYPLGFVGLFLQLWSDRLFPYRYNDVDVLWDALAYIPKTVVVGTGIQLLWLSLIATSLTAGIAWLTLNTHRRLPSDDKGPRDRKIRRTLWGAFLLSLLPPTAFVGYTTLRVNDRYDVLCLAGFLAFSAGGGVLVGSMRSRAASEWFRPTLVAAFIAALFAALCIATLDTPNVPLVEINASPDSTLPDCPKLPKDRTFVKLSQSSNVIYLYNRSGLVAFYIADIQPIRDLPGCTLLRTQRT